MTNYVGQHLKMIVTTIIVDPTARPGTCHLEIDGPRMPCFSTEAGVRRAIRTPYKAFLIGIPEVCPIFVLPLCSGRFEGRKPRHMSCPLEPPSVALRKHTRVSWAPDTYSAPDPLKARLDKIAQLTADAYAAYEEACILTEKDVRGEESTMEVSTPRVQGEVAMDVGNSPMSALDPEFDVAQRANHGESAAAPFNSISMSSMLLRALIMFTGGVGGPWPSGLGFASEDVTKGLVLAAADAIEVGLGWLPKARPDAVTAACGVLDRREALAYLIGDAVLGLGLIPDQAARSVGQAAGKLVWVAKGTAPVKQQVAKVKAVVQREASKLTPEQLVTRKADAEAKVLCELFSLPLPAAWECYGYLLDDKKVVVCTTASPQAATQAPLAAPAISPTTPATAPATAAAAAAPPAITPPPAIADTLADAASPLSPSPLPHQTPPSFAPHFTMDDADIPDVTLPLVPWCDARPETLSIYQDVVCRARDERRTLDKVRAEAAGIGVQFCFEDVMLADGRPASTICAQPPPCRGVHTRRICTRRAGLACRDRLLQLLLTLLRPCIAHECPAGQRVLTNFF